MTNTTTNTDNSNTDSNNDNSQDNDTTNTTNNTDNSTNNTDSNNDNRVSNRNSFNTVDARADNSSTGGAQTTNGSMFGDGALVATSNLSSYVSGVRVTFEGNRETGQGANNSLSVNGSAYQNFAGMQAQNLNTGAAASQNANVSVAVSANGSTIN